MIEKTLIALYRQAWYMGSGLRSGHMLQLYKPEKGAKVLGVNVWCSLISDIDTRIGYTKPQASFPELSTLNPEEGNEYLIQEKEHEMSALWVNLYVGRPGLPENLGDPVYKEVSPQWFSRIAGYPAQVYGVPQEFDLLEEAKGDVGYFNLAPSYGLFLSISAGLLDKNKNVFFDGGDVPSDERYGFSLFTGPRSAYCWGDRISIFGSALENE